MSGNQEREALSPRRREVLDAVRDATTPLGVTEVADRLAVHPNTVRLHLDALVTQGRVERTVEPITPTRTPLTLNTTDVLTQSGASPVV